jgi:phosphate/sulfate permease
METSRFTLASGVVALLGCLVAFVGPLALGASPGIRGSVTLSAVVGAVFAGKNMLTIRQRGAPSFAAGAMATVLGLWLIVAPLQYETVGAPLTALTQFGGMCLAAFSAYTTLVAVERFFVADAGDRDEGDSIGYS